MAYIMSQPSCSQKSNSTIYSDIPTVEDESSYVYVICNVEKWKILHDQGHKGKELLPAIAYIGTSDQPFERYRQHTKNYNEQTHKMLIVQEFNREDKFEQQTEMIKWEIALHKIARAHGVDIDSKDGYHGAKKLNKIIHATLTEEELKGEIKSTLYEVLETCSPFDETKKEFVCNCGAEFYYKSSLENHRESKHSDMLFICDICKIQMCDSFTLATHTHLHDKQKCAYCALQFADSSKLQAHEASHLKPKVKCPDCEREFAAKWLVEEHVQVFHHKIPFQCRYENCDKSFNGIRQRRTHEKTHDLNRVREFKCPHPDCTEEFFTKRNLNGHINAFHGGDLYNTAEKVKHKSHRRRISAPLTLSLSEEDEFVLPDTPTTSKRNRKYDDDYENSPKTPVTPLSKFSFA